MKNKNRLKYFSDLLELSATEWLLSAIGTSNGIHILTSIENLVISFQLKMVRDTRKRPLPAIQADREKTFQLKHFIQTKYYHAT